MEPNLVTLTQDEITRFEIKDKVVGDTITAEEYSAYTAKETEKLNKEEAKAESEEKSAKKSK